MMAEVRLRATEEADLETLFEFEQDEAAARLLNFAVRPRDRFLAHWHKVLADPTTITRTVLVNEAIAGNVGCWNAEGEWFIGYWFGREFWGRGIGTAAVRAMIDEVGHRPLFADPAARNIGSVRVLEKCGFERVESMFVPDVYGDGKVEHIMLKLA